MLQIGEPKFKIGDAIVKEFSGAIEGVETKVKKTLYVIGIQLAVKDNPIRYWYTLGDKWPASNRENAGREYTMEECVLTEMEPLCNEIARAQAQAAQ